MRLDPDEEAGQLQYDLSDRPWWREVLTTAADPETRTIDLVASTQVGKTLSLIMVILYLAKNAPAAAMVVLPDRNAAMEFRDRLYANAEASGLKIPPVYRWNLRFCNLEGMRVYLAWSGSRQTTRSRRCKYVFLSEVDVFRATSAGDPVQAASQRTKAFARSLVYRESSPLPEPSRIDRLEHETDRRRWWARCPHCGRYQELRFFTHKDGEFAGRGGIGGLKNEAGDWLTPEQARSAAHYVCLAGCKITPDQKPAFVRAGQWLPRGQEFAADGSIVGERPRSRRRAGFRLWAALSGKNWGDIAEEFLNAQLSGTMPDFYQNWLSIAWRVRSTMPTWQELGRRLACPSYGRGVIPPWVWFLTGAVDLQSRECYVSIRGWGDHARSALIDWFVFERVEGDATDLVRSDLAQLDEAVLRAWWPVAGENPRGRTRLQVALLGTDSGFEPLAVHNWIRSHPEAERKRIRATKGDHQFRGGEKYKPTTVKESKREGADGTGPVVYEGGMELWLLNVDAFRTDLAERFQGTIEAAGAWLLPRDILAQGQFYLQQVANEPPVIIRGKDGRQKRVWQERVKGIGHDYWDTEVYNRALAQMIVDQLPGTPSWDATKWDTGRRPEIAPKDVRPVATRQRKLDRSAR